jgi:short-subunit dehydrogenase
MKSMDFRGKWVMVTGASSGLGRSMADVLAREHGANIVPVARRQERLLDLKRELETRAGVKVEPVAADLSKLEDIDRALEHATAGRQLYAAVLNAGVTHFGGYDELTWSQFEAMLNTNVTSIVRMTTALVPHLEKGALGGGIMLVSSMAGITPLPYQAAYSGTKAFVIHFGCAMSHELYDKNVSITIYAPGGIATEMTAGERFNSLRRWLMPVEAAAREGVDAFRRRKYLHVPGATNKLGTVLFRLLPQRMVTGQVAASYRRALALAGKREERP